MVLPGKALLVDLSQSEVQVLELSEEILSRFLGGRGLNAWQLLKHVGPDTDPLGPDNVLILSCGLLTGTEAPASSRLHIGARSPLTGLLGSSNVGGHFGAELRAAGYQTLVIRGRASEPSYLWISPEGVEIRSANKLWGQDAWTTQSILKEEIGGQARVMAIGVGGENQVRYACIMTERGHAAGRTGMGAVMGSKNLKALVVQGEGRRTRPDEAAQAMVRDYLQAIKEAPRYETYSRYSNSIYVTWANQAGILGTRNYRQTQFEDADEINGSQIYRYVTRSRACYRCPVHCKAEIKIESGRWAGIGERPDIEPIMALGSKCGLDDVEAVLYLYNLCGQLGIDVISAASALAFVMDLFERGIITAADTDGIELTWGDAEAMEVMLRHIAYRQGFGDTLAEGVRRAAEIIGRGAVHYAYHAKGLELTGYDPRGALATALGYAVSNRGGDFTSVYATPEFRWDPEQSKQVFGTEKAVDRFSSEGKGLLVRRAMIVSAVLDSIGICKVPVLSIVGDFSLEREARLVASLCGWPVTSEDLLRAGERIVNAERLFNLRHGAGPEDDDLPDKFVEERVPAGPTAGMTVDIQPMIRQFYRVMGWDNKGWPTQEKLTELGL